jgi:UDP-hydrolysing UDP-N-acetyl-D-glucosamine 2-epimerase
MGISMAEPIRLVVISTSRSDLGPLAPVVTAALRDPQFDVHLVVCGMHLEAGTPSDQELERLRGVRLPLPQDSLGKVHQVALAAYLAASRCEAALVLGDRCELLEAALACIHARVVLVHCSGGERSMGAWDDQVRDAVTKLAHVHCTPHEAATARLVALAEEPWRIATVGEPGLDAIGADSIMPPQDIEQLLGIRPTRADIVVAVHPVTRYPEETGRLCSVIGALAGSFPGRLFLSSPNGDPGSDEIRAAWHALARHSPRHQALADRGAAFFRGLTAACGVMVGNSSAGLIEAPSLGTPTIDLGRRQAQRLRGDSVVSCAEVSLDQLQRALVEAHGERRRSAACPGRNPYGDGQASPRILAHVRRLVRRADILVKA